MANKSKKQQAVGLLFDGIICSGAASLVYAASLIHPVLMFIVLGCVLLLIGLKGGKAFNELSK